MIFASTVFVLVLVSVNCVSTLALNIAIFVIRVPIMVLSRKSPNGFPRFSPEFSGETGMGVKCTKLSTKSRKNCAFWL